MTESKIPENSEGGTNREQIPTKLKLLSAVISHLSKFSSYDQYIVRNPITQIYPINISSRQYVVKKTTGRVNLCDILKLGEHLLNCYNRVRGKNQVIFGVITSVI